MIFKGEFKMLTRTAALDMLQNVLWSMMQKTETCGDHAKEQARGIILDIEPILKTNKVKAIKDLRDWINDKQTIVLPTNLGNAVRITLKELGYTYYYDDKEAVIMPAKRFSLKESKDFVDLMDVVMKNTEAKSF
jgi:ribosomal protein L7/L12